MAGGVHSPVGPAGAMGRGCEIRSPLPAAIPPPGRIWHWQPLARRARQCRLAAERHRRADLCHAICLGPRRPDGAGGLPPGRIVDYGRDA